MTGHVQDMRFCPWEGQTLPVDHDCIADARIPCEARSKDGQVCGCCRSCIAAQKADPRYSRPTDEETP